MSPSMASNINVGNHKIFVVLIFRAFSVQLNDNFYEFFSIGILYFVNFDYIFQQVGTILVCILNFTACHSLFSF